MKKKIILAIIFVALVGLGIFFAFKLSGMESEYQNYQKNNTENINTNKTENKVENNQTNNTVVNNTVANNTSTEEVNVSTITKEEDKKQKAVNIAKDNWGEDDTVTISFDGVNINGKYEVIVTDKATTKVLYRYIIDIDTGTFTIE